MHKSTATMATATSALATRLHAGRRIAVLLSVTGLTAPDGDVESGLDLELLQRASLLRAEFALRATRASLLESQNLSGSSPETRQSTRADRAGRDYFEVANPRKQAASAPFSTRLARELVTA